MVKRVRWLFCPRLSDESQGYGFVEAMKILTGQTMADWKPPFTVKEDESKVLILPPENRNCDMVTKYLL